MEQWQKVAVTVANDGDVGIDGEREMSKFSSDRECKGGIRREDRS